MARSIESRFVVFNLWLVLDFLLSHLVPSNDKRDLGLISMVDIPLRQRVNGATDLGGKKVRIGTTRVSQMTSEMG